MRQVTLCFLIKENQTGKEVLLAMKKRGLGIGKWNGVGGKLDPEKGDRSIMDAAIRETEEEIGVKIKDLEKVAVLSFYSPPNYDEWEDQCAHVFLAKKWEGEPKESEEMSPRWFRVKEIPYGEMWEDDRYWLPKVLEGKKLKAKFVFKEGDIITKQNIEIVKEFL